MALKRRGTMYYAIVRVDGRQRWIRVGTVYREAKKKHDELIVQAAAGTIVQPSKVTFAEFADEWEKTYCAVRLKRSTMLEYASYLKNHLKPFFGDTRMSAIGPKMVQDYVAQEVRGGRLSPKSVRNHVVVLKRLMASAVEWGVIDRNPASKTVLPRIPQTEMAFLTPSEVRRLLDSTPEGWSRLMLATACLTGARKGEILAMKHDSWSLAERIITVRRTLYAGELQEPKSKRSMRVLPMPESLAVMYASLVSDDVDPQAFVFHLPDGRPLANGTPNRILRRALKKAGLPEVTFHALRHSFVAAAIASEVPIKVIQELVGHASIQMTLDRYGHLLPSSKADAAKAIDDLVNGA